MLTLHIVELCKKMPHCRVTPDWSEEFGRIPPFDRQKRLGLSISAIYNYKLRYNVVFGWLFTIDCNPFAFQSAFDQSESV